MAQANWRSGDQTQQTSSNEVRLDVISDDVSIETYRQSIGSALIRPMRRPVCSGSPVAELGSPDSDGVSLEELEKASSFTAGENLVFLVSAPRANRNPGNVDSLLATLTSESGDRETLEIFETGPDSGEFAGIITTASVEDRPVGVDCRISSFDGDTIAIESQTSFATRVLARTSVGITQETGVAVTISKTASRTIAAPGDVLFYTVRVNNPDTGRAKQSVVVVDRPSASLRLRKGLVAIDGEDAGDAVTFASDGREMTVTLPSIAPGGTRKITYASSVRADASAGEAINRVTATDRAGNTANAGATVKVERETIGTRMTLIGRITEGSCELAKGRRGIPGVQVMLEDGSFAVTDADGRYHFEGLMPGTHVAQVMTQTLPKGGFFVDCSRSTANAGSAVSRFVRGQGGSLAVADFHAVLKSDWQPIVKEQIIEVLEDAAAAGAETDWLALGDGPIDFLFPEIGHNPRAPAVRAVIRHKVGQTVDLVANGKKVDPLSFDGVKKSGDGRYAVSIWRGLPLTEESTTLDAVVRNPDGSVAAELSRKVEFAAAPARAELISDLSSLVADGTSRPVIAVRITDRRGRPVRSGISGSVAINAPYESAQALETMQLRQLSGLGGASPTWSIEGDDGIALIELAPTMVSGPLRLDFVFSDGEITRNQDIESWITPGDQEWTLVGLVEGSVGARTVADNMERAGRFDSDLGNKARTAFYAKGRVLGKFLLTAAYDSAKQRDEERLQGIIDPRAYYTVFGDGSVRRFDAASREKLYVRIETGTFYALYGDFLTGFDQTQLARYNRAATGVKAEGRFGDLHVTGFAAEIGTRYRRDEIQGGGISGPYRLSSRNILVNSERVTIEVRDRFRSELVVERRELERFVDYDIDILSGTITFTRPFLSRDADFNPQFAVIDYEVDELTASGEWNAGARADVTLADGAVRLGATAITDKGDGPRTDFLAGDARVRIGAATEVRAELAASRRDQETSVGWLVEAEHHTGDVDLLAFVRSLDGNYGVGQESGAERGRRKAGLDARYRLTEHLSVTGSAWRDDSLIDASRRNAVQIEGAWRTEKTDLRAGIAHFSDRRADGTTGMSTVLEAGASHRLLDNRLELSASTSIALSDTESIDLPTRHRFGARYAVTNDVRLLGSYEIAEGDAIDARTFRGGIEVSPWTGGRINTSIGQQSIGEYGKRSFSAFGLAQSLQVTEHLTIDATVDGNRRIGGVDANAIINTAHPVASGGHLGQDGELFEDFTAATLGASWRKGRWSATGRGEWRDGETANRKGFTFGAIRQLGEGSIVGSGFTWSRATGENGTTSEIFDAAISAAHRPAESPLAFLGKLEFRSDAVTGATFGETGPAGRTALTVSGDAKSRRLIASLSSNWSPTGHDDEDGMYGRTEIGVFVAGRYILDRVENFDLAGFTALGGVDARIGIGELLEVGGRATVRANLADNTTNFAFGPEIGFIPAENILVSVGYNVEGFRDRDFSAARNTDKGLYASIRMKFDSDTFSFLGLGR
ncbi:MAG: hypothetical protein R3D89_02145 [Sphingomonadaceae bacterium]